MKKHLWIDKDYHFSLSALSFLFGYASPPFSPLYIDLIDFVRDFSFYFYCKFELYCRRLFFFHCKLALTVIKTCTRINLA